MRMMVVLLLSRTYPYAHHICDVCFSQAGEHTWFRSLIKRWARGGHEVENKSTDFCVENTSSYPVSQWNEQDMDRFGGALHSAADAGLMIAGDEFSEIDGYDRVDR